MSQFDIGNVMAARLFNCNRHLLNGWTFEQFVRDPMYALITAQVARQKRWAPTTREDREPMPLDDDGLVFLRKQAD